MIFPMTLAQPNYILMRTAVCILSFHYCLFGLIILWVTVCYMVTMRFKRIFLDCVCLGSWTDHCALQSKLFTLPFGVFLWMTRHLWWQASIRCCIGSVLLSSDPPVDQSSSSKNTQDWLFDLGQQWQSPAWQILSHLRNDCTHSGFELQWKKRLFLGEDEVLGWCTCQKKI